MIPINTSINYSKSKNIKYKEVMNIIGYGTCIILRIKLKIHSGL